MRLASAISRRVPFSAYPALGLLVLTGACASGASENLTVEPEAANPGLLIATGAEVYGNNCARCHNARAAAEKTDLEWDLIVAHMRARANLTGGQARAVQAFLATVNAPSGGAEGEAPMEVPGPDEAPDPSAAGGPDYTHLVAAERLRYRGPFSLEDLPSYPPTGEEPPPQEAQEDLVEKGRTLSTAKGCIGCHVLEEKGGNIGPSLDDLFERRKEDFVRDKLTNPRTDNPNSVMPDYGLSAEEVGAFLAYLKTLGNRN